LLQQYKILLFIFAANVFAFLKKNQYISLLFLTAISLVLAHGIVPHHHFDASCIVNHCDDYKVIPCQSPKPPNVPWHCQAYNNVLLIEQQLLIKFKTLVSEQYVLTADQIPDDLDFNESVTRYNAYYIEPITCHSFVSLSSLRAPPALT